MNLSGDIKGEQGKVGGWSRIEAFLYLGWGGRSILISRACLRIVAIMLN